MVIDGIEYRRKELHGLYLYSELCPLDLAFNSTKSMAELYVGPLAVTLSMLRPLAKPQTPITRHSSDHLVAELFLASN